MADPIGGGIGKASQQMMQELQKQMDQNGPQKAGGENFGDMVAKNTTQTQGVQDATKVQDTTKVHETSKVRETQSAASVLKTAQVNASQKIGPEHTKVAKASDAKESGFKRLLGQVVDGQNKLDDIIRMATSGKTYNQQELLAIQASVYKFSQELDLTSKVVEKATSGIKQTMQTQV